MLEVNYSPSRREVRVFGFLWLLFFAAVGAVVWWKHEGLLVASIFLTGAWLLSLIFNPVSRGRQMAGVAMPLVFGAAGGAASFGPGAAASMAAAGAVALAGAVLIWSWPNGGRGLYVGWMSAVAPVGWSVTRLVLAAVYYGVLTPIGLAMRIVGRDPMKRRFDPSVTSYWVERSGEIDASRYFRQF